MTNPFFFCFLFKAFFDLSNFTCNSKSPVSWETSRRHGSLGGGIDWGQFQNLPQGSKNFRRTSQRNCYCELKILNFFSKIFWDFHSIIFSATELRGNELCENICLQCQSVLCHRLLTTVFYKIWNFHLMDFFLSFSRFSDWRKCRKILKRNLLKCNQPGFWGSYLIKDVDLKKINVQKCWE